MELNMSQELLAQKAGTSRQTIISMEKGKYCPSLPLAMKIAKIFNRQIEDIFVFSEEEKNE
ncbi:helix-turn-helix transcriptional regulator [Falsibacillus albus]|uniref:Transcriptional regulator n=1 Tax=Falsibacillus albus TaxID=2478915 RepID=A0A3L7JYW9_9BACI|nr:helix-turn-helix transcriptional regulator [Falsibacillus albus]RLQ94911.1 transcriptional regulator [Falsibacillus albus]